MGAIGMITDESIYPISSKITTTTVSCRPQLPVPMIIHTGIHIAIILPDPDPRVTIGPFSEQIRFIGDSGTQAPRIFRQMSRSIGYVG